MPPPLNGLQDAEVFRPQEFAAEVELTSSSPANRTFSTRVCEGFEVTLLIGDTPAGTISGQRASFPTGTPFIWTQAVWSAPLSTCGFLSLEVAPGLYKRLASEWPETPRVPEGRPTIMPAVLDSFWRAHRVLRTAESAELRSQALILLLSKIFAQLSGREAIGDPASPGLERVRTAIHDEPARGRSIEALASLAALSPFEFVAAFRRRYGLSPAGYREAVRISAARRLLTAGRSVEEAAHALGYQRVAVFRSRFLRSVGLSAERYAAGLIRRVSRA